MYHSRVVVPVCLQEEVLEGLHAAHQGVEGMHVRARKTVFRPNITRDLEEIRARCSQCNVKASSQAAIPPKPLMSPDYPFKQVMADYWFIKDRMADVCRPLHRIGVRLLLREGSHRQGPGQDPDGVVHHLRGCRESHH